MVLYKYLTDISLEIITDFIFGNNKDKYNNAL
jgi:hypothetical protein